MAEIVRHRNDEIDVGMTTKTHQIFIAVPPQSYDRVELALTGGVKHVSVFSLNDAKWLVKALRKEIIRVERLKRKQEQ